MRSGRAARLPQLLLEPISPLPLSLQLFAKRGLRDGLELSLAEWRASSLTSSTEEASSSFSYSTGRRASFTQRPRSLLATQGDTKTLVGSTKIKSSGFTKTCLPQRSTLTAGRDAGKA